MTTPLAPKPTNVGDVYRKAVQLIAAEHCPGFEKGLDAEKQREWTEICKLPTTTIDEIFTWTKRSLLFLRTSYKFNKGIDLCAFQRVYACPYQNL